MMAVRMRQPQPTPTPTPIPTAASLTCSAAVLTAPAAALGTLLTVATNEDSHMNYIELTDLKIEIMYIFILLMVYET